jgi:hypothetical protein
MMFLGDKDWAQVVKTNHYLSHHYLTLGRVRREKRVGAQAKPISELLADFEQSLRTYRPATRRVYVAAAKRAIRSAHLELWQCPSTGELLASLGESPTEKKARISPFLNFLGDGELEELVSDEDSAALQNWVIQRLAKQMGSERNPSITTRRDFGLIAALCAAPGRGTPRKWPENCLKIEGREVLLWDTAVEEPMLRCFLALLACLERAPGPTGPTAALPQIFPMEPIKAPFPRAQRRPLESGSSAQRSAATRLRRLPQQHRAHHSGKDQSRFPLEGSS